jgi:xanthosine utilization system XapX-like protein
MKVGACLVIALVTVVGMLIGYNLYTNEKNRDLYRECLTKAAAMEETSRIWCYR